MPDHNGLGHVKAKGPERDFGRPDSYKRVEFYAVQGTVMTIRVAAIEVSHWHALNDAAYLRHLVAMPEVELVAVQDSDAALAAKRARRLTPITAKC
jgi:hypothetical protein